MTQRNLMRVFVLGVVAAFGCFSCEEAARPVDPQTQFIKDVTAIDNYLAAVGISAYKDNSGIRFVINQLGNTGLPPTRSQRVKIVFTVKFFDGTIAEAENTLEGKLSDFLIAGLVEGIEILPEGTKATLYVPSALAYGPNHVGTVPENTNLIYEIELEDVIFESAELAQLNLDSLAIDEHLSTNSINAEKGPFGIRYVIQQQGAGIAPTWFDKVKVTYTGKLLATNVQFFSGTVEPAPDQGIDSRVVDYLRGLQVAFQLLPPGTKATFYIPSTLGFGSAGAGNGVIPANANLIYEINSLQIVN